MAITRFKNSSILNRGPKYNDFLAGLPFRPVIGTATDGGTGTTVSVAFTGNNPAGAGITYTALSSPGSITATGPASPITVTGLTSGTAYTFQVKAGNSLGDSAYSGSSNSVTPVTPTAFDSIATATGTGSSNTISFSSITGNYQHLQFRGIVTPDVRGDIRIKLNGSTSGYRVHYLSGNGTNVEALSFGLTYMPFMNQAGIPSTSYPTIFILDIHDYASTTKTKVLRMFVGSSSNSTGAVSDTVEIASGLWNDTSAITSISFGAGASANWTSSSSISMYGIKGA